MLRPETRHLGKVSGFGGCLHKLHVYNIGGRTIVRFSPELLPGPVVAPVYCQPWWWWCYISLQWRQRGCGVSVNSGRRLSFLAYSWRAVEVADLLQTEQGCAASVYNGAGRSRWRIRVGSLAVQDHRLINGTCVVCVLASQSSAAFRLLLLIHTQTTVLRPFFWDHPGEPVPEENLWTLWCKGTLIEADTPPSGWVPLHLD